MKISLLFSFLMLIFTTTWGQNDSPSSSENKKEEPRTECSIAREKATADFNKGVRKLYFFGIFDDVKYRRQLEKYDIRAEYKGCLMTSDLKCYSDCMYDLIAKEKGFGFFEKVKLEAGAKTITTKTF